MFVKFKCHGSKLQLSPKKVLQVQACRVSRLPCLSRPLHGLRSTSLLPRTVGSFFYSMRIYRKNYGFWKSARYIPRHCTRDYRGGCQSVRQLLKLLKPLPSASKHVADMLEGVLFEPIPFEPLGFFNVLQYVCLWTRSFCGNVRPHEATSRSCTLRDVCRNHFEVSCFSSLCSLSDKPKVKCRSCRTLLDFHQLLWVQLFGFEGDFLVSSCCLRMSSGSKPS